MHVISGLPRSGSTLLCNVLNQNPQFFASSTSMLPALVGQTIQLISGSPEMTGDLGRDRAGTEARVQRVMLALCEAWYGHINKRVIFDKSRGWPHHALALRQLYPNSKMIILVRDLREVFASFEKQHRKFPLLDQTPTGVDKSIFMRADKMFSPKGMIGNCLKGIQNLLMSRLDVLWLRYEDFVNDPAQAMNRIYCYLLEETEYQHDFDNVVNTATDADYLYLNKYPHSGEGKIRSAELSWPKFMSRELANGIMATAPWYNQRFSYGAAI